LKPAPFDYVKPNSVEEVFDLLDRYGDDARLLAGGQSLLPSLNMRLSAPAILIDITGQDALRGIVTVDGVLRIGALTTYAEVKASAEVARAAPMFSQAIPWIAHPAIRNRGTVGGSLVHADPAAELPACMLALDAQLEIAAKGGRRRVAVADFFRGLFETNLKPGEMLMAIEVPVIRADYRSGFSEFSRRSGDFAISGLAAHARFDGEVLSDVRLAYCGVDTRPVRARIAERVLEGRPFGSAALAEAKAALAKDLAPPDDLQATGQMKLHLSQVLAGRVLTAMGRADGG
jgi:aerobic carbon-monoxide dehydrogenase medium subunit